MLGFVPKPFEMAELVAFLSDKLAVAPATAAS